MAEKNVSFINKHDTFIKNELIYPLLKKQGYDIWTSYMVTGIVYSMQLLTSNMIARLIFTTLPGSGLRFLIGKLIKG